MKRLAIIGAGDLGLQLAHLATATGIYSLIGYYDDTHDIGAPVGNSVVLGSVADVEDGHANGLFDFIIIAIGYRHMARRRALQVSLRGSVPFATLIHPSAIVDATCQIDAGAVIFAGCVLDMKAHIGANALINVGCVIAHHSHIGANSFLSPAVSIAGFVEIGESCVLGIGTIVIDNLTVASGVRTGAGAVVVSRIQRPGLWIGVPARYAKDTPLL